MNCFIKKLTRYKFDGSEVRGLAVAAIFDPAIWSKVTFFVIFKQSLTYIHIWQKKHNYLIEEKKKKRHIIGSEPPNCQSAAYYSFQFTVIRWFQKKNSNTFPCFSRNYWVLHKHSLIYILNQKRKSIRKNSSKRTS